jgi:histone-lysine N-methyltransferase SETD7
VPDVNVSRSPKATVFLYPGLKFAITGTFDRGVKRHLIRGRAAVLVGVEWQPSSGGGIPVPIVRPVNDGCCPHTLAYECPTSHSIASVAPTRKDYYEMQTCRVATSSLGPAAGEGLFAARDINNGELIALFNGVRTRKLYRTVPCDAETDDNWSDYSITLNKEMSLDIPNDSINLSNYSATSAHKACHSFSPNAKFARLFHPRFGNIMSVVASEDLKMGEEVLVHYRYQIASSPLWYRALWKSFLRKQGWSDYTAERYGYSAHEVGQYFKSINDRITKEADI